MNLDTVALIEINWRKATMVMFSLMSGIKKKIEEQKQQHINRLTENKLGGYPRGEVWEEVGIGEGDQEVQTIRYKINVTEIQYTTQGNSQYWSIVYKNIKSLCCTPEANIIL